MGEKITSHLIKSKLTQLLYMTEDFMKKQMYFDTDLFNRKMKWLDEVCHEVYSLNEFSFNGYIRKEISVGDFISFMEYEIEILERVDIMRKKMYLIP